ncbi:rsp-4 [Pristionchus pacificus]|nr:rsp-4 [Pristionchus pacificus]
MCCRMARRPPPEIEGLTSLKVDNISYNTTPNDLRRLFDKYGEIGDIHIPRDRYNRQSRGFGFVRFYSRRDAEYAQDRTDGKFIDGREIRVSVAKYDRPQDESSSGSRGRSGGRGRSRSRSRSPYQRRRSRTRSPPSRSRSKSRDRSRSRSAKRSRSRSRSRSASPRRDDDRRSRSRSRSRSNSR